MPATTAMTQGTVLATKPYTINMSLPVPPWLDLARYQEAMPTKKMKKPTG